MTSRSRNARPSTKANTIGRWAVIESLKSFEPAVMPVTSASTPPTLPIVAGMTSSRSVASAAFDVSSVPLPCIGMDTTSTVLSGLVLVVTGSDIWPLASARSLMASMPAWTSGLVTSSAWTATSAGIGPPGNAAWMRS